MTEVQPCRLFLVRRGETTADDRPALSPQQAQLTSKGRQQAAGVGSLLGPLGIDAIFTSAGLGSRETAEVIGSGRDTPIIVDSALDPVRRGKIESMSLPEMESVQTPFAAWLRAEADGRLPPEHPGIASDLRFPGGESVTELFDRVQHAFLGIVGGWQDRTVVIVSDSSALQAILCHVVATDVQSCYRFATPHTSVTLAEAGEDGRGVLQVLNWDLAPAAATAGSSGEPSQRDSQTCRVFLIRHGQAMTVETGGQVWSHHPVGLTEKGREQAAHAASMLRDVPLSAIYTSDLNRARETAETIGTLQQLTPAVRPDLREIALGHFEGMTLERVYREVDESFLPWLEVTFKERFPTERFHHRADLVFPGGESILMLHQRVRGAFAEIVKAHAGETIAIVSHTWVIQPLLCHVTACDPSQYFRFGLRYATMTMAEVDAQGRGVLAMLNGGLDLREVAGGRLFATAPGAS